MKKTLRFTAFIAGLVALPVLGANVTLDRGSYKSTDGGEFRATDNGALNLSSYVAKTGDGQNIFQTFCLEVNEFIDFGNKYNYVVNTAAVNGGVLSSGSDPLSKGTAWLYSQFVAGTLKNYNYTPSYESGENPLSLSPSQATIDRRASAYLLQQAIWALEDEVLAPAPNANVFYEMAKGLGATFKDDASGADLLNVRVLNLTLDDGTRKQDVLVVVPEPSTYVAAALLLIPAIFQARRMRRTA